MAPPDIKAGPVTRVCHVCGRQYGLSSFDIHLKQCKKLFIAQEEQKPKHERRPLPKTPPGLDRSGSGGGSGGRAVDYGESIGERPTREMVDAMNRAAQETFNEHGMEKCENCGRTFAEGRLAIHLKSCRPGNAAKRVVDGAAPRNKKEVEVDYGSASPQKKNAPRPPSTEPQPPARQETSAPTRPLTGSLASNRRRADPTSNERSRDNLQSPLPTSEVDAQSLKKEMAKTPSMIAAIKAKLDRWEATTLATLQEIRDLKELFSQLD